jgi:DNA-binding NarL/FixJ family response regulator
LLHPKKNKVTKVVVSKNTIKLTSRQNQILDMVTNRGASNKMIAKTLNISESTVKLHIGTILKKFGVRNRTQLAIFGKSYTHV